MGDNNLKYIGNPNPTLNSVTVGHLHCILAILTTTHLNDCWIFIKKNESNAY